MSDFPECERFVGRVKQICRCEILTPEKCNQYRAKMGLHPLPINGEPVKLTAWQRIKSFGKVMTSTAIRAATTGRAYVSAEVRAERFAICQACPHFAKNECALCGCSCSKKSGVTNKLAHASSTCPIGKWGPAAPEPPPQRGPKLIGVPIDRDKLVSHILYHVMPVAGETEWVWRKHLDRLREVRDQFNGRLIVGVVTPGKADHWKYHSVNEVREALTGLDAEIVEAPNHVGAQPRSGRGENILWPLMLEKIQTTDPDEVFFYGHCKGVSRPGYTPDKAPHIWADAMFETLFRNHAAAIDALDHHGTCGPFRMTGGFRPGLPGVGDRWFFSGTFFAMRSVDVFRRKWRDVPRYYGGVERMPQAMFRMDESACLFFDNVNNLYDDQYWRDQVVPALNEWRKQNGTSRANGLLPETPQPIPALVHESQNS